MSKGVDLASTTWSATGCRWPISRQQDSDGHRRSAPGAQAALVGQGLHDRHLLHHFLFHRSDDRHQAPAAELLAAHALEGPLRTIPAAGALRPGHDKEKQMIEVDNPPLVLFCVVMLAFLAPQLYSFFVDKSKRTSRRSATIDLQAKPFFERGMPPCCSRPIPRRRKC